MKHLLSLLLICITCISGKAQTVEFYGAPTSPISSGAIIPEGKKMLWTSGTVGGVVDSTAQEGTPARFGDTKAQALNILNNLQKTLKAKGLSFKDVLMLRVYVAPDKWKGTHDYQGWFEAYAQYFGTKENPVKPIRSTVGIASLVSPEKFIEIELVAVYP
ncbi:RidA family protein [Telluribacter humicola]|uniref:RidA family protein n=1 Tax=Telluribacter humicola TaxID=1720261 RepID=UPI001A95E542|nr:RidA family protein [Telluribacter humicola]